MQQQVSHFLRQRPWQLTVFAVLLILVVRLWVVKHRNSESVSASSVHVAKSQTQPVPVNSRAGRRIFIHIAGAVRRPGLYQVDMSQRVGEVLKRAGGATVHADLAGINLAKHIADGQQILVPFSDKKQKRSQSQSSQKPSSATAQNKINLNIATLEQLDTLDGVGPVTAKKILDYRKQHGRFRDVQELDQIAGIGEKRLAALRSHVTV